jgi:glycerol transport system substrate-binding protein
VTGEKTPQAAMDNLADQMDRIMARLERAGMKNCPPSSTRRRIRGLAVGECGAVGQARNEKPKGETIAYDKLLQAWKEGRAR